MVIFKTGEKTVCRRPIQKLMPFEITINNDELSNNEAVNDSKRAEEMHKLNSRRPTGKTKEQGPYLRELQDRYG